MSGTTVTLALTNWADAVFWGVHSHKLCAHFKLWNPFQKQGIGQLRIIQSTLWAHHLDAGTWIQPLRWKRVGWSKLPARGLAIPLPRDKVEGWWQREDMGKRLQESLLYPMTPWGIMRCRGYFGKNYVIDVHSPSGLAIFGSCHYLWRLLQSISLSGAGPFFGLFASRLWMAGKASKL